MSLSTRALEGLTALTGSVGLVLAQMPTGEVTFITELTKASPTALMVVFLIVLWNRYTKREDEGLALAKEAIQVMQTIKDRLKVCPRCQEKIHDDK